MTFGQNNQVVDFHRMKTQLNWPKVYQQIAFDQNKQATYFKFSIYIFLLIIFGRFTFGRIKKR